jgi:calcium-dependent protein kinase
MYILLSGKYPFYGNSEEEITRKILTGNYNFEDKHFIDVSENAKDLIKRCLIHDKNKRITVKEALRHEFFTGEININNIFEDEIDTKNILINLKNNSRKISKFYQIVLAFLSYNFADKEELKKLRKIFYKIDLNLDGKLTKEELYLAYREADIKINKSELEKIIDSIDFDGNGSIEYEEFIRVTLPKEQLFTDVNLKIAFDMFDIDKNGTISMREILEVIGATDLEIDKKVIDQLKKEILTDGDEEINFKHFKEMMLKLK